jgi:hypothetical protein
VSTGTEVRDTPRTVTYVARAITYLLYFFLVAVEIILALGFLLLLFGASPTAPFVEWVYRNLDRAMAPFRGMFAPIDLGTTGTDVQAVFDTSVLFAMVVYGIVAMLLHTLIAWLTVRLNRLDRERRLRRDEARYGHAAQTSASHLATPAPSAAPAAGPGPPHESMPEPPLTHGS